MGNHIEYNWIWSKAKITQRKLFNDADAAPCHHVAVDFIKRCVHDNKVSRY